MLYFESDIYNGFKRKSNINIPNPVIIPIPIPILIPGWYTAHVPINLKSISPSPQLIPGFLRAPGISKFKIHRPFYRSDTIEGSTDPQIHITKID
ncbi:unnamed protein product [Ambrosiozyma monospora]|uniref:Unnamed protein product n=1 Tax=Ambrosiozyma monospora TaxID=43982 RepID=A0A9W7DFB9_AMBMO|nr:unnamed protein product [Ambrosiozyma monospora]